MDLYKDEWFKHNIVIMINIFATSTSYISINIIIMYFRNTQQDLSLTLPV